MESDKYVTIVPVEYRNRPQFIRPPDEYSDFPQNRNWPHTKSVRTESSTLRRKELKRSLEQKKTHNHCVVDPIQSCFKPIINAPLAFQTAPKLKKKPLTVYIYTMADVILHTDIEDAYSTTVSDLVDIIIQQKYLGLSKIAKNVFTIWMKSNILEVQLKPHHNLLTIFQNWHALEDKYCIKTKKDLTNKEPILSFQRNVFFLKKDEEKIKDQKIIELLYAEAKYNVLQGRYPVEVNHCLMLASLQCRIELGPHNLQQYTSNFFKDNRERFFPQHLYKSWSSWINLYSKSTPHSRLADHLKHIQITGSDRKLYTNYLECCYMLPFYGCAFFRGQIEQPVRGLISLINHKDFPVFVAVNTEGVYILDYVDNCLLLSLKFQDFSWELAKPNQQDNDNCLPCIFLQFLVLENGTRVSKILQIFSKQAVMIDAIIAHFVEDLSHKLAMNEFDDVDRTGGFEHISVGDGSQMPLNHFHSEPQSRLFNKLNKLTLATFDEAGHCVGQMGSWSFSY